MENGYHIERISCEAELRELQPEWDALMEEAPGANVFFTPEWIGAWWSHCAGDADLWMLAARDSSGRLAGLAPWMRVRDGTGPIRVRRIAFLGTGILYPVHLDLIASACEQEAVAASFLRYLRAHRAEWDVLDLNDLHPESCLKARLDASGLRYVERPCTAARFSRLPDSFETYERELMTSSRRGHMRQRRRKLEREHEGVRFDLVTDPAELSAALDALGRLNQHRWNERGMASAFDFPEFMAFHHAVLRQLQERGWLRFYLLHAGTEVIAAIYGLQYKGVFYAYQAAFDETWGRYTPGYLLFTHAIKEAIGEGVREWNMESGDQEYKLSWTHEERCDLHLAAAGSVTGTAYLGAVKVFDTVKTTARARVPQEKWDRINQILSARVMKNRGSDEQHKVSD